MNDLVAVHESDGDGEFLIIVTFPIPIDPPLLGRGHE